MSKKHFEDRHDLTPIQFVDLSVVLGQKLILDKINCKIKSNSITAVLGPNGAGKSIFLQTINGLVSIQSGRLTFNSMQNNQEIREQQAMVFQTPVLLRRTVMANMQFVSCGHSILFDANDVVGHPGHVRATRSRPAVQYYHGGNASCGQSRQIPKYVTKA